MRWDEPKAVDTMAPGPQPERDYGDLHALTREIKGKRFTEAKQALAEMLVAAEERGRTKGMHEFGRFI